MKNSIIYILLFIFGLTQYKNVYPNSNLFFQGSIVTNSQLNKLKIGLNSKKDIIDILGNPSIVDPFTNKIWFYVNYTIKRNKIINLNKFVLYFNEEDILIKIKNTCNK